MNYRECECGGNRVIVDSSILKVSGDQKIRLRCNKCRSMISVYKNSDGISVGSRKNGRPFKQL